MILWIASYPRSGNTFLRVVLKAAFGLPSDSLYAEKSDITGLMREVREGLVPGRSLSDMAHSADLCCVKTHDLPGDDDFPAIYVVRDGRDALVSYAHYALEIFEGQPAPPDAAFNGDVAHAGLDQRSLRRLGAKHRRLGIAKGSDSK